LLILIGRQRSITTHRGKSIQPFGV
jgi:hypothetical protein